MRPRLKTKSSAASKNRLKKQVDASGSPKASTTARVHAQNRMPVAAVGASAGGLEAFTQLLSSLGPRPGLAVVFIAHLAPEQAKAVRDLLARSSPLPVAVAAPGTRIEVNHVYVVPPARPVEVKGGQFVAAPKRTDRGAPDAINRFFESFAAQHSIWPIGVILSGALSDGTNGCRAIRAEGGVTIAQDPSTASFDAMPRSAITAGLVDIVAPPGAIGTELQRLAGSAPIMSPDAAPVAPDPTVQGDFREILELLRTRRGVDFRLYKTATLQRRLMRRVVFSGKKNLRAYRVSLENDRKELDDLFQDLLINVTSFFREPTTFDAIARTALPDLVKGRDPKAPIRVWVPGCSTGEEVYSLAILIQEFLAARGLENPVQLFGTDVSEEALAKARQGLFSHDIEAAVNPALLKRYFARKENGYQIDRSIRDRCVFAVQNLLADPPFSHIDLLSCRNVLIYLQPEAQRAALSLFHFALARNGFLVLGASETIPAFGHLFVTVDRRHKIYERRASAVGALPAVEWRLAETVSKGPPGVSAARARAPDLEREVEQAFLAHRDPAGVVVDQDLEILRFQGETSGLVHHRSGASSLNLAQTARGGLGFEVRALVARVRKTGRPAVKNGVPVGEKRSRKYVDVQVLPLGGMGARATRFLVLFEKAPFPEDLKAARGGRDAKPNPARSGVLQRRLTALERELRETRDFLRATIDEQERVNDQLQIATEELESRNEELQSMNEELQTAKEELQASNEELVSTNEQLNSRNQELGLANADLSNLIDGTGMPIVILDGQFRIRRFSPASVALFNLRPSDVGRPLSDLSLNVPHRDLVAAFRKAVATSSEQELEISSTDGTPYLLRILPYKDAKGKNDGVVLSFIGAAG